jgi:hypothetical protein
MNNLVNVFYNGRYNSEQTPFPIYECTTDNFPKWLVEHNKERAREDQEPDNAEEFNVEPMALCLYEENDDE